MEESQRNFALVDVVSCENKFSYMVNRTEQTDFLSILKYESKIPSGVSHM